MLAIPIMPRRDTIVQRVREDRPSYEFVSSR